MSELLALADQLYALPLDAFTPARDAQVKEHKGQPLAAELKRLRKPSLAAWVVNLLVRVETEQVEQILEVGAALRQAQAAMSAQELRELTRQRRQLTAAVTTRARAIARERGVKVTEAVATQVQDTLTAAMLDEGAARAVRSGLLVAPLAATGVDAVDVAPAVAAPEALGFAAAPVSRELRAVPTPEAEPAAADRSDAEAERRAEEERLARERAREAAERSLRNARDDHARAERRTARLSARVLQLQAELEEARRRVADLEVSAEDADEELASAEQDRDEAAARVAEAEAEVAGLSEPS